MLTAGVGGVDIFFKRFHYILKKQKTQILLYERDDLSDTKHDIQMSISEIF